MGGERANIAELAAQVSRDIFKIFKWNMHPTRDENFECIKPQQHFPETPDKNHNHPTDVAFYYYDPYLGKNIYFLTDLKSFSDASLKSNNDIKKSLFSLAQSIDCASLSSEWNGRYVIEDKPHEIRGFLFVYNHDNKYNGNFRLKLAGTKTDTLPLKHDTQIHLFGPEQICQAYMIALDLAHLNMINELGKDYTFVYPNLVQWRRLVDLWDQPATIETIISPYIIIKYRKDVKDQKGDGYVIYYSREGNTVDEFVYLIDTLSRFQILGEQLPISLRLISPDKKSSYINNFERAKERYLGEWGKHENMRIELELFSIGSVQSALPNYSSIEAGWRHPNK